MNTQSMSMSLQSLHANTMLSLSSDTFLFIVALDKATSNGHRQSQTCAPSSGHVG